MYRANDSHFLSSRAFNTGQSHQISLQSEQQEDQLHDEGERTNPSSSLFGLGPSGPTFRGYVPRRTNIARSELLTPLEPDLKQSLMNVLISLPLLPVRVVDDSVFGTHPLPCDVGSHATPARSSHQLAFFAHLPASSGPVADRMQLAQNGQLSNRPRY